MDRSYTIEEIDNMRLAVEVLVCLRYGPQELRDNAVELRLRTYMMAGVDPQELMRKAREFEEDTLNRTRHRVGDRAADGGLEENNKHAQKKAS